MDARRNQFAAGIWILLVLLTGGIVGNEAFATTQATTIWSPYAEWSVENPSWSGNPFDVVATVTFTHQGSGETRATEMFYTGGDTWRFRFAGTRVGDWTFSSTSADPQLNGVSGSVTIEASPDAAKRGFLVAAGKRFAHQIGSEGNLEGFLPQVFHDDSDQVAQSVLGRDYASVADFNNPNFLNAMLDKVEDHGTNALFVMVYNEWFKLGAWTWDQHSSETPDLNSFAAIETVILAAQARGLRIHFWAWGDEQRRWTPVGVGGINGVADRRVQRYIAARLGPLPGWTMSYGFDLEEWATDSDLQSWASSTLSPPRPKRLALPPVTTAPSSRLQVLACEKGNSSQGDCCLELRLPRQQEGR